jgi:ATP-dependent exoDNAse (exonuclease V) beta subunit
LGQLSVKTNSAVLDAPSEDAVTITTIHQAKGLHWPVVMVAALTKRDMATRGVLANADTIGAHLDKVHTNVEALGVDSIDSSETERLVYVALTRARDHLFVSGVATPREHLPAVTGAAEASRAVAEVSQQYTYTRTVDIGVTLGQSHPDKRTDHAQRPASKPASRLNPEQLARRLADVALALRAALRFQQPSHLEPNHEAETDGSSTGGPGRISPVTELDHGLAAGPHDTQSALAGPAVFDSATTGTFVY